MKWITHQTFAVTTTLAFSLSMPIVVGSFIGSTIPDQVDYVRSNRGKDRKKWYKIHRGISHFWLLYVVFFVPLLFYSYHYLSDFEIDLSKFDIPLPHLLTSQNIAFDLILGVFLGIMSHIFTDMFNPTGVPVVPSMTWRKRFSFKFFKTNSIWEYAFLASMILFLGYYLKISV